MIRRFLWLAGLTVLVGCAADKDLDEPFEPIGEFRLGHNIVVADNAKFVPPSRRASEEEWETAMKKAIDRRFSRFQGDQLYHIAISVEGYSIAVPGVPIVLSPKSVMIIGATVWDDAAGGKINQKPKQITVLERLSGETVVGSGLTQSKAEQIENLANNAARLVEKWMRSNPEWFVRKEGAQSAATASSKSWRPPES
ncbi:hypothetical protein [Actibacterium sp. 188UL27-1]|uniref:hypothetical protein n=1 Tax=Actibacterium sp. 188UL27-1 TaxID=2786961 RepID=UPI0019592361|nr:hypothetical protein [Actibacterium sp. 188UL27-1]MBM7069781.1 hypothetical protein [Actibacterium sp. 188UL27-1]